jgi:hypothetical protein
VARISSLILRTPEEFAKAREYSDKLMEPLRADHSAMMGAAWEAYKATGEKIPYMCSMATLDGAPTRVLQRGLDIWRDLHKRGIYITTHCKGFLDHTKAMSADTEVSEDINNFAVTVTAAALKSATNVPLHVDIDFVIRMTPATFLMTDTTQRAKRGWRFDMLATIGHETVDAYCYFETRFDGKIVALHLEDDVRCWTETRTYIVQA